MQTIPCRAMVGLLVAMTLATGCSFRELAKHERTGSSANPQFIFNGTPMEQSEIIIGGVVLGSRARLDKLCAVDPGITEGDVLAQADGWSHNLRAPLIVVSDRVTVWPWPEVRDRVPESELVATLEVFASGGILRPNRLAPIQAAFPTADHLVIARVDYNLMEDRSLIQASGLRGSIGRTIEVTLECYDLKTATSAWRVTKRRHNFGKHLTQDNPDEHHVSVLRDTEGNVDLEVPGVTASAPGLEDMIAETIDVLVLRLLDATRVQGEWEFLD